MWHAQRPRIIGAVTAAALIMVTTAGCNLLGQQDEDPVITSYVTGIQVLGDAAENMQLVNQPLGAGEADGPVAQVTENTTVVNGGSVEETITSEQEFTVVRFALEELLVPTPTATDAESAPVPTSTGAPARGYHEIKLRQASTTVDLVVTVAQALPNQNFQFYFAVVDAAGKQGPLATQTVQALNVGTGAVQVSISWNVDSDVDLHVVDPNGEEVYFGHPESASGGKLDLDSNPDCDIDGKRNENITWKDTAPPGTYTVRVSLWDACGVSPSKFVVTIQVAGEPTRTYTGTLEGEGEAGGEGAGVEVTTFEVGGVATSAPA
ncbi:MAG: hypothetical protein IRY85_11320 [Micromonosporaceae bacterium]|nr:hypothetical protein [Micromonosporaceae bacterium]